MKYLTFLLGAAALCVLSIGLAQGQAKPDEKVDPAEGVLDRQSQEVKQTLFQLTAAIRSYRVRYDEYPVELGQMVDRGLIPKIPADPWGTAIRYSFLDGDESGDNPHYELRAAGVDHEFNSDDDVIYSKDGLRLKLSRSQRARILEDGGRNYTVSRQAWAWEQAYRLWLAIAEYEFREGKRVASLKSLTLPEDVFASGEPVDEFGRTLEFRDVRGVRAVLAPEIESVVPALSLSESEFVHYLRVRLPTPENDDWRLRQVMEGVLKFRQLNGRLPLTMNEVNAFLRNSWISRNNDLFYLTLNNDTTFVVISCGVDRLPGGRNENLDTIIYGPKNALGEDGEMASAWWDSSAMHHEIYKDIKAAIVEKYTSDGESENGGDKDLGADDLEELGKLPDSVRKQIEEALKKAGARGLPVGPKRGEKAAAVEEKVVDEEVVEEEVTEEATEEIPEDEESSESDASSSEETDSSAHENEETSQSREPNTPFTARDGIGLAGVFPDLALMILAQDENAVEASETYTLAGPEELVPATLYTQDEARELSIFTMEDWRTYRFTNPVRSLFSEAWSFKDKVGPDEPFPCGNVALSNAETFVRMSDSKSWTENDYWDDEAEEPFAAFLVTKMERDEYNNLKSLVCIGIPMNQNADPIVVFAMIDGNQMGPFFSRVSDQPEGWVEQVVAYNGEPDEVVEPEKNEGGEPADDAPSDDAAG